MKKTEKKSTRPLTLNAETLRLMDSANDLQAVWGGARPSANTRCNICD